MGLEAIVVYLWDARLIRNPVAATITRLVSCRMEDGKAGRKWPSRRKNCGKQCASCCLTAHMEDSLRSERVIVDIEAG